MKKKLPLSSKALAIHKTIVDAINNLLAEDYPSPISEGFKQSYQSIVSLFKEYQDTVIAGTNYQSTCKAGCHYCCYHWVEDVYSFEAAIIADYLKKERPQEVHSIIQASTEDEEELIRLNEIVEQKLFENRDDKEVDAIDQTDLLLSGYYQLQRPCPLLSDLGMCSIYPIRPLTCRIYMSFHNPEDCSPENINTANIPTYLLDLEEEASKLLDALHEKHKRFEKTGLRALLIDYLSEDT